VIAPRSQAMAAGPVLPEAARAAAREAAFLRLLGLLFERPRSEWAMEIRSLAEEVADGRLREIARTALTVGEGEYLGVFGPGGSVSPREAGYGRFVDPGRVMAGLSGIYQAFAFHPRAEDPIDHVAVEVGFAGYLALKEAYALSIEDQVRADQARAARALFLETHLRPFAAAIRGRLAGSPLPHLESAGALLAEWAGCPAAGASGTADDHAAAAEGGACAPFVGGDDTDMTCGGCGTEDPARPS